MRLEVVGAVVEYGGSLLCTSCHQMYFRAWFKGTNVIFGCFQSSSRFTCEKYGCRKYLVSRGCSTSCEFDS